MEDVMSDRLKAMSADVVDVSEVDRIQLPGSKGTGGSPSRYDPRDEVRRKQESGY